MLDIVILRSRKEDYIHSSKYRFWDEFTKAGKLCATYCIKKLIRHFK